MSNVRYKFLGCCPVDCDSHGSDLRFPSLMACELLYPSLNSETKLMRRVFIAYQQLLHEEWPHVVSQDFRAGPSTNESLGRLCILAVESEKIEQRSILWMNEGITSC